MRKLLLLIPVILLFAACGEQSENEKPVVVATTTIIADIADQLAGDKLDVRTIMPVGGDPHIYQPVPGDARLISNADLVLLNGLQLDVWIEQLVENARGDRPYVRVTEGIEPLRDPENHEDPDPHVWFDVSQMNKMVDNIIDAFIQLDPDEEEFYREQSQTYKSELEELHQWVKERISTVPKERRVLITSHDAFQYFGKAYDVEVIGLIGISTEARAQTRDMTRIIEIVRDRNLPAVFVESSVNPRMIEQISSETGARIGGELFSDSVGPPDHEGGTYTGMIRYNVNTFVEAMSAEPAAE